MTVEFASALNLTAATLSTRLGMSPERNLVPRLRESTIERLVVRLVTRDRAPELARVIQGDQMAELVNEQIADDRGLEKHQRGVQAHGAAVRAASPTCALQAHLDLRGSAADDLRFALEPRFQVIVGFVEEPTSQRIVGAAPVLLRRRNLEHRLARTATQWAVRVVPIFDVPPPADREEIDRRRRSFAVQRATLRELAACVLDPAPVLTDEGIDVGSSRAARHDELERMRRQQAQRQIACPPAFANAERRPCELRGTQVAARFE